MVRNGACPSLSSNHKGDVTMKSHWFSGVVLAAGMVFAGTAQADLLIGVAGPLTGPNAAFGAQLQNGAQMAADDINAAGGVLGEKISLTFGDDVSDPKQGVSVANKFVGDGVEVRGRPLQLGRLDPGFGSLRRERRARDHPARRPTRSSPSAACGTPSAPAVATISRARLPAPGSPRRRRDRRSPSSTTRPRTDRALPTRPRRR